MLSYSDRIEILTLTLLYQIILSHEMNMTHSIVRINSDGYDRSLSSDITTL